VATLLAHGAERVATMDAGRRELTGAGLFDWLCARCHDPRPGAMLQVTLAPCSLFSVTARLMQDSGRLPARPGPPPPPSLSAGPRASRR